MDWTMVLANILILTGAFLMLVNIIYYRQSTKQATHRDSKRTPLTKMLVRIHLFFMGFFLLGYLGIFYLFHKVDFANALYVSIIFFFGAVFVFMGIVIQKRMLTELRLQNTILEEYNAKLKNEQASLLELNNRLEEEIDRRIKAQESDQLKSDFLSLVSHELRTPLTSIYGFAKLLEKGISALAECDDKSIFDKKKKRIDANLSIICSECNRLTRLINNFLDLAKIESGRIEWNNEPTSLQRLIGTSMGAVEGLFVEKDSVSVQLDIPSNLPDLRIDADRMNQVLINLINNAIKFTDEGTVTLSVSIQPEIIKISVKDEGRGIEEKDLSNIFDKFYIVRRGDTLGGKQMGTGLGLPICKQIIEHYNGHIWVESIVAEGSTFHVELPSSLIVS